MLVETLETLFHQHGYILVVTHDRYHAFMPTDIDGDQVKRGSCPVMTFTWNIVPEITRGQAEQAMRNIELLSETNREPFDTTQPYRVGLAKKFSPEWSGWPIADLRKMLGIDK